MLNPPTSSFNSTLTLKVLMPNETFVFEVNDGGLEVVTANVSRPSKAVRAFIMLS